MPRNKTKPAYLLHKPSGQARCRVGGKDFYLGAYGSQASRDRYEELVAEWFARSGDVDRHSLTVDDVALMYMAHAEGYYRRADGSPTSEIDCLRAALKPLIELFGPSRVREFGPLKLKQVRDVMVERGHCRTAINKQVHRIRRMIRWGVENEHVPASVAHGLAAVAPLKAGRSAAKESERVRPVEQDVIDATLPHLSRVVAAMVKLQLLTGGRPGEIASMRPGDVDRSGAVWSYQPAQHKTLHRGKERRIFIGPQAQSVLLPFLERAPDAFCFSPREAEAERRELLHATRKTPAGQGNAPGTNRSAAPRRSAGDRYLTTAYCRAVCRACEIAFAMPEELRRPRTEEAAAKAAAWRAANCWSPNQLRHTRATALREQFGIEAASVVLGHSDVAVTQIYAEKNFAEASRIMADVG